MEKFLAVLPDRTIFAQRNQENLKEEEEKQKCFPKH